MLSKFKFQICMLNVCLKIYVWYSITTIKTNCLAMTWVTKNEMISDEKRVSTLKRKPHDKPTLSREVLLVILET